ncbi:MAG: chemotaxis protein CheC [Bacillota bacterium]|jgi:chemotaxis protein CheC
MIDEFTQLSDFQLDALREIGNIGAGNAATSLSMMINRRIEMSVPQLTVLPFSELSYAIGGPETLVVGVYLQVQGMSPCGILFLLPHDSSLKLAEMLLDKPSGSIKVMGEMEHSALMELGNILAGAYLNALAMFTDLELFPSVPSLATDMSGAILSAVVFSLGEVADHALLIETKFTEDNQQVVGHFLLLPEPGSLDIILERLGVNI